MRIATWNCNGAYRNKPQINADIVVIQECEKLANQNIWFGEKRGIGIFSNIELQMKYSMEFRYVLPLKFNNINLFAIWAMDDKIDHPKRFVSQVYRAMKYYHKLLDEPTIIIGDFNWNIYWDNKLSYPIEGKWCDLINLLDSKNIKSVYHKYFGDYFGGETQPTFYQFRDKSKPYHIDYCFVSKHFKVNKVEVGKYNDWIQYSDHMPLTIELT